MTFWAPRLFLLLVCILNGKQIVQCTKTCSPLVDTPRIAVTCIRGPQPVRCTEADEGTVAIFECKPFYEAMKPRQNALRFCKEGNWNADPPKCVPECGKMMGSWQAGLYMLIDDRQVLICEGTLLNEKVILTAAHCVTDQHGKPEPKEKYTIAVGKLYSPFNDSREFEAQFSKVDEIIVSPVYKGLQLNYSGDLALLVVEDAFELNRAVSPVCIDRGKGETQSTADGTHGIVTGWGFTKDYCEPSDDLKKINVTTVPVRKCEQDLPADFVQYLTPDKMCAASVDEVQEDESCSKKKTMYNSSRVTNACTGISSGDGLILKNTEDNRYYIHGIASVGPKSGGDACAQSTLALYTKVTEYLEFISENEMKFL